MIIISFDQLHADIMHSTQYSVAAIKRFYMLSLQWIYKKKIYTGMNVPS